MSYRSSRMSRVEERKSKRKSLVFILLTIGIVVFMLFYGVKITAGLAGFLADIQSGDEPPIVNDITPPAPPFINSLPEATNDKNIRLRGRAEPGVKVIIYINGDEEELVASKDGEFSFRTTLEGGENTIYTKAIDAAGNESQDGKEYRIVYDRLAPDLFVYEPLDGASFSGEDEKLIEIKGEAEIGVELKINERIVTVSDENGEFSFNTSLSEGENVFIIVATDKAGNSTERQLVINYSP